VQSFCDFIRYSRDFAQSFKGFTHSFLGFTHSFLEFAQSFLAFVRLFDAQWQRCVVEEAGVLTGGGEAWVGGLGCTGVDRWVGLDLWVQVMNRVDLSPLYIYI
jgi:hypothetical protein